MLDLYAVVGRPDIAPPSRHSVGLPIAISGSPPEAMAWPLVLLIEFREDGIFLVRYGDDGSFAGDTWHQALEDAQSQAREEYGDQVRDWTPFPDNVEDKLGFALSRAHR